MRKGGLPGHMAKARRVAGEMVPLVDAILEVVDARAPLSTHSPEADALALRRPLLVVMTHADGADSAVTCAWLEYWRSQGRPAFAVDAVSGAGVPQLRQGLRELRSQLEASWRQRGRRSRPLRAVVVGLPNVGKSSLLNRLAGRSLARTGARPGITRGQQWLRSGQELELLDLPGMLPARAGDERTARVLVATGVLPLAREDALEVAGWLLAEALGPQAVAIAQRAGAAYCPGHERTFLWELGKSRGRLKSRGEVDLEGTAVGFLKELAAGKLGRFSLEAPPETGPS